MHSTQGQLVVLIFCISFEPLSTEIVAVKIGSRYLGRGVVAFEDKLVVWQPGGVHQAGMYHAQRQVMEAAVDAGEGENLEGRQGGEDLHEDLEKGLASLVRVGKGWWATRLAREVVDMCGGHDGMRMHAIRPVQRR